MVRRNMIHSRVAMSHARGPDIPIMRKRVTAARKKLLCHPMPRSLQRCLQRVSTTLPLRDLMKIHEYQGKGILRSFGVPVPRAFQHSRCKKAVEAAKNSAAPCGLSRPRSTQVVAAKNGGVKVAKSIDDVKRLAGEILGMQLKTRKPAPKAKGAPPLHRRRRRHQNELYISLVTDRATQK